MSVISEDDVTITAKLPGPVFDQLKKLAEKRGISANNALVEAILNESYLVEKEASGSTLLLKEKGEDIKILKRMP